MNWFKQQGSLPVCQLDTPMFANSPHNFHPFFCRSTEDPFMLSTGTVVSSLIHWSSWRCRFRSCARWVTERAGQNPTNPTWPLCWHRHSHWSLLSSAASSFCSCSHIGKRSNGMPKAFSSGTRGGLPLSRRNVLATFVVKMNTSVKATRVNSAVGFKYACVLVTGGHYH